MFGRIATKQDFVIFFQASIMTQATLTHFELGHVTCFKFKQNHPREL
ncbi:hypothetical protein VISI1226_19249 [Vibrio sinaloensis DSM 21326]|uniref:Uncharacterized protein n=1 Tax=Vibrio sinaloensis DSM 21326 TaxID=945550 RepID=E8M2C8_PHOS4|nr:hypothetical protein VISI1226_19249 [Vibrio sinaloensis DSM 21326]